MQKRLIAFACVVWIATISFEASRSVQASAALAAAGQTQAASAPGPEVAATPARQLVTTYCVTCHNEKLKTAGLLLDKADAEHAFNSAETWEKVIVKLRSRAMPPPGIRRPDNATYDAVAGWLEAELDRAAMAHADPGRPSDLHRLNRAEYANSERRFSVGLARWNCRAPLFSGRRRLRLQASPAENQHRPDARPERAEPDRDSG